MGIKNTISGTALAVVALVVVSLVLVKLSLVKLTSTEVLTLAVSVRRLTFSSSTVVEKIFWGEMF